MIISDNYESIELEVIPGECVYATPMHGMPDGVFLNWRRLTQEQKEKFNAAHEKVVAITAELQALFHTEFDNMEDVVDE